MDYRPALYIYSGQEKKEKKTLHLHVRLHKWSAIYGHILLEDKDDQK